MEREYAVAGWLERLFAIIIDLIILALINSVLPFGIIYYRLLPDSYENSFLEFLCNFETFILAPAYFILMRYFGDGQTLGKRLLSLRTVSIHGRKLKLWEAFMDCLGYIIWPIDFFIGFILSTGGDQRMTQLFSQTIVVRNTTRSAK